MTRKIPLRNEGVPEGRGSKEKPTARASKPHHEEIPILPYNPKLKQRARELRRAGNLAEILIWNAIKNKRLLGLDFDRQRIIGHYIVDFYCHSQRLVLEVDGDSHYGKHEYDSIRDAYLRQLNLRIVHLSDRQIKRQLPIVLRKIALLRV